MFWLNLMGGKDIANRGDKKALVLFYFFEIHFAVRPDFSDYFWHDVFKEWKILQRLILKRPTNSVAVCAAWE